MKPSRTKSAIRFVIAILFAASGCFAQNIPSTIRGKWAVRRELPTRTISCWGEADAKKIIGTQIEYLTGSSAGKGSRSIIPALRSES